MPDNLADTILTLAVTAGCCVLWGVSTGAVYWDLRRIRAPDGELAAWMALVALVPGVGLLAYLTWRMLGTFLSARELAAGPASYKKRITAVQRPDGLPPRKSTIPAADLLRATLPDLAPRPGADPVPDGFALQVDAGPHASQTISLARLPATIGRGAEAGVQLDEDLGVSRHHAELYLESGALRIRDLGSTHGTLVNGYSISDKGLESGDRIRVGMTEMVLMRRTRDGADDG